MGHGTLPVGVPLLALHCRDALAGLGLTRDTRAHAHTLVPTSLISELGKWLRFLIIIVNAVSAFFA